MHSFWGGKLLVVGTLVGSISCAAVAPPVITPAPVSEDVLVQRQINIPNPISFAQLLLTAIPQSLRQIAATNAPAVSSILNQEFLDDNRPQWFLELPYEIQSYLIRQFGPSTALLPTRPTSAAQLTRTESLWSWPTVTGSSQPSRSTAQSSVRPSSASRSSGFSSQSRSASFSTAVSLSATASGASAQSRSAAQESATGEPQSPPASNAGLTKSQKIGLGVGIPFGILGAAALLLGCCFLLRRRRNKKDDNSERASSPGFIPRFAFQDKSTDNLEHRKPLNPGVTHSSRDFGAHDWDEDGLDPFEYNSMNNTAYRGHVLPPAGPAAHTVPAAAAASNTASVASAPMAMHDATPIMAPVVFHTHSSNRARGKRTSYSSLHSVAEVSEPDDSIDSPVLGRHTTTPLERKRRPSMPMVLEIPATPMAATKPTIKRKPVPTSPIVDNSAADLASESLLRPAMPRHNEHSGSSSSGLALSTHSSTYANPPTADHASPISPISSHPSWGSSQGHLPHNPNPFSNDYSYVEDYGPEYHNGYGYVDANSSGDVYGGHKSLSDYPNPSPPREQRRGSGGKTEWPLRNMSLGRKRRESSPLWDRVYESP